MSLLDFGMAVGFAIVGTVTAFALILGCMALIEWTGSRFYSDQ